MAEREDANPLSDPPLQRNKSALRSFMGRTVSREPDPELGVHVLPAKPSALPHGYPELAEFLDSDENWMVSRRFGLLHSRVLYAQEEISHLERRLNEQDENARERDASISHEPRDWLLKAIEEKLSDYNVLISRICLSAQTSRQSAFRYQSVREYLNHGPPIHMDCSKIRFNQWADYEGAVDELLKDPETAPWLDGPLDQDWSNTIIQQKQWLDHDWRSVDDVSGRYKIKRTLDHMAGTLFWISHISSALGFVLIYNASGAEGHPLLKFLLAYWYFSAVSIIVQGFYAKGFVYARKVFLGGLLACPAGFYVLNILLNTPRAASFTAMPTIFTVVLLLIRTI